MVGLECSEPILDMESTAAGGSGSGAVGSECSGWSVGWQTAWVLVAVWNVFPLVWLILHVNSH